MKKREDVPEPIFMSLKSNINIMLQSNMAMSLTSTFSAYFFACFDNQYNAIYDKGTYKCKTKEESKGKKSLVITSISWVSLLFCILSCNYCFFEIFPINNVCVFQFENGDIGYLITLTVHPSDVGLTFPHSSLVAFAVKGLDFKHLWYRYMDKVEKIME